jgi:hypothetical protein
VIALGVASWRRSAAAAATIASAVADTERALAAASPDRNELSDLYARLSKLDGDDRGVRLCLARIDLVRGRYEQAAERLGTAVQSGAGELGELRTAAIAWQQWHARGGRNASERQILGRQALELATGAARLGDEPLDWFVAWQAAVRLPDDEAAEAAATALQERHATSLPGRTLQAIRAVQGVDSPTEPLKALAAEWPVAPVELQLAIAVLELGHQETERALAVLDELAAAAPNVLEVRNWAATAHHVAASALPPGNEQARHAQIRDGHLGWLDANAPVGEPRRAQWMTMR